MLRYKLTILLVLQLFELSKVGYEIHLYLAVMFFEVQNKVHFYAFGTDELMVCNLMYLYTNTMFYSKETFASLFPLQHDQLLTEKQQYLAIPSHGMPVQLFQALVSSSKQALTCHAPKRHASTIRKKPLSKNNPCRMENFGPNKGNNTYTVIRGATTRLG